MDRVQVRAEESALLEKFGSEYVAYRAASPRWLSHRSLHFAHVEDAEPPSVSG